MNASAQNARFHTPIPKVIGLSVALALIVGLILLAFSWPAITADPKDVPVGVVGSTQQVDEMKSRIAEQSDGAVALTSYDDRDAAVSAIEQREVYGAVVLPAEQGEAPEVLTATAANPAVAQMLQGIATTMQAQIDAQIRTQVEQGVAAAQEKAAAGMKDTLEKVLAAVAAGQKPALPTPDASAAAPAFSIPAITVKVTDIAPFSESDPRGAGLSVAALPLVMGGLVGGVLLSLLVKGAARRMVGVVLYSAITGTVLALILQTWYGALQGSFGVTVLALSLAVAAISAVVTGLYGLLGRAGIGVGAVLMMLIGNPLSGAAMPIEFMMRPWGAIGQMLPPGAAGTLLRELSYFPKADMTEPWLVLSIWTAAGLLLTLVAAFRERAAAQRALVAPAVDPVAGAAVGATA